MGGLSQLKLALQRLWYAPQLRPVLLPLIPLSIVYLLIIFLRKLFYKYNVFNLFLKKRYALPIVVVGNITVGGTGKTPLVIHIARTLKQHGIRVGIVSRGYLGQHEHERDQKPIFVYANSDPTIVGDEPLLLAKRLFCPIVIAKKRTLAVQALLDSAQVDVILSDDGLQHEAMERDIEIIVIDGQRRFGNGWCLPAGPLREPMSRLKSVDFVVSNSPDRYNIDTEYEMELRPRPLYKGILPSEHQNLIAFREQPVHAVAGIGFPERFFELLKKYELKIIPHPFPDHHPYTAEDLNFKDDYPVIMTEKDAVKCDGLMNERHWVLPVEASLNPLFDVKLLTRLQELLNG